MLAKLQAIKNLDVVGASIALAFVGLAVGATYAALHFGWFRSPWELGVWVVVCISFLVIGLPTQGGTQQGLAQSKWATRVDIERADIDEKTPRSMPQTEAGKEGVYLGFFADDKCAITLRYKGGKHLLSFGTPGANKSAGLVVPNLAHLPRSCIVIDVKAELASITAQKRAAMGRVIVLNPFALLADDLP